MKIFINSFDSVYFDTETKSMVSCTNDEYLRYLKGVYTNKERFMSRYVSVLYDKLEGLKERDDCKLEYEAIDEFIKFMVEFYDNANQFTFEESFKISNREFQALVFSSINITQMVHELGATRYKTDGAMVKHRQYDKDGTYLGDDEYHNVYEIWEVNGEKLGVNDNLYVIKCWCTSTNKEHWLWVDEKYKDDPLEAISSTFRIHQNLIPFIKCLKRQGDVLLVELTEDVKPEGEIVSLNKDQYFSLLVAQS